MGSDRAWFTLVLVLAACEAKAPDLSSGDAAAGDGEPAEDAAPSPDADVGIIADAGVTIFEDAGESRDAEPPSMLLTVQEDRLMRGDEEVDFRGAISCCGGGYGWPLFDEAWMDYVLGHDARFLHLRLGPFLTGQGGESDWSAIGGGYASAGELADLSQFNELFWNRVRDLIAGARARGMWVEVDVIDGWALKHCRWGDLPGYSAWSPDGNVQGEDLCATAGSEAIAPGSRHEAWIERVVEVTGAFDNVFYQDGNEVGLVDGYDPAWTESMAAIIRAEETRLGFVRHLFATNSGHGATIGSPAIDLVELHANDEPDPSECFGKPCLVNEYNPRPALSAEDLHARFCTARAQGIYFWYWRHDQDEAEMDRSLALLAGGCE